MAEITDTEVVAPDMRRVQLGSESFRVPPSPTLKYMFYIRRFIRKFQDGTIGDDDIESCFDETIEFLRRYNKSVDEDRLLESCELTDLRVPALERGEGAGDRGAIGPVFAVPIVVLGPADEIDQLPA